jgi:hypothetical protein
MVAWGELAVPLYPDRLWCGPASGVSIAIWQRNADGDTNLDDPPLEMFKEIRTHMGTTQGGITWPWSYGPGFVNYAIAHGEHFNWAYRDTFAEIMSDHRQ